MPPPQERSATTWLKTTHLFQKDAQGQVSDDTPCEHCGKPAGEVTRKCSQDAQCIIQDLRAKMDAAESELKELKTRKRTQSS